MIADFLNRYRPGGPHCLSAIVPDGKIETATFTDAAKAAAWAQQRNTAGKNLYFHVNTVNGNLSNKAAKTEIARVDFLHLDLDPRVGEGFTSERQRILGRLNGSLSDDGIPPPTLVIDSGGGFAAYWRLAEPVQVDGDAEKIAAIERYNVELANRLGGDNCHDVSRLMRLPGLTSWPNKKKRERGRVPAATEVYDWPADEPYPLSAFPLPADAAATTPANVGRKAPRAARERLPVPAGPYGVAELQVWATEHGKQLPDTALAALVHGEELTDDDGNRVYPSGSEATWAVCCGLARAGVPDELIVAATLDKNNGGAAHVLRQQKPTSYAWSQAAKARASVEAEAAATTGDDLLDAMNERHAVVIQGKVRVLSWIKTHPEDDGGDSDLAGRLIVDLQSFEDFRNRYRNKTVVVGFTENGKPKLARRGDWWLDHEQRREIRGLVFRPGAGPDIAGFQNLWRGWAVEPEAGDWSLMREHVRAILAAGNEEHADYIIRWTAWAVQNPARQAEVALVFRGGRGVGKGIFARAVKDLFGQHGLHIRSSKHLTGDFNLHLRDCCLLFADEAIAPGDKARESQLKGLITEPELLIEGKGIDAVNWPNYLHIVMASNEKWVIPAGDDERRYAIFDASSARQQDPAYFGALAGELKNGGLAAMLFDLLSMDLGEWHPRANVTQTDALVQQKIESLSGLDAFMFDLLRVGDFPVERDEHRNALKVKGVPFVATSVLRDAAAYWLRSRHGEQHVSGNDVSELMATLGATKYRRGGGGERGFLLPSLTSMRHRWDALKFEGMWPTDADSDDVPPEQESLRQVKPPF